MMVRGAELRSAVTQGQVSDSGSRSLTALNASDDARCSFRVHVLISDCAQRK